MSKIVTGSISQGETLFHLIIIEEHFNIFNSYVKLTIKNKKKEFFKSSIVFEHKIKIPGFVYSNAKDKFYWERANKEIRTLANSIIHNLENTNQ